jgi:hypothetical protein
LQEKSLNWGNISYLCGAGDDLAGLSDAVKNEIAK